MKFKKEENENKFKSFCKLNLFKNVKLLKQYKILLIIVYLIKVKSVVCMSV